MRVLTASPAERLVSLAALKTELGISGSAEDARLLRILDAVGFAFAAEVGYPLPRQRYRETLAGTGRQRLVLTPRPLDPESVTVELSGVATTDFQVEDERGSILVRSSGWPDTRRDCGPEDGEQSIAATFYAGWVLPEFVETFAEGQTAPEVGTFVRPTSRALSPLLFEVTVQDDFDAEPTWSLYSPGDEIECGDAVLVARTAFELPAELYEVAIVTAIDWRGGGLDIPTGIQAERHGGSEISYDFVGAREAKSILPAPARAVLARYV